MPRNLIHLLFLLSLILDFQTVSLAASAEDGSGQMDQMHDEDARPKKKDDDEEDDDQDDSDDDEKDHDQEKGKGKDKDKEKGGHRSRFKDGKGFGVDAFFAFGSKEKFLSDPEDPTDPASIKVLTYSSFQAIPGYEMTPSPRNTAGSAVLNFSYVYPLDRKMNLIAKETFASRGGIGDPSVGATYMLSKKIRLAGFLGLPFSKDSKDLQRSITILTNAAYLMEKPKYSLMAGGFFISSSVKKPEEEAAAGLAMDIFPLDALAVEATSSGGFVRYVRTIKKRIAYEADYQLTRATQTNEAVIQIQEFTAAKLIYKMKALNAYGALALVTRSYDFFSIPTRPVISVGVNYQKF